MSAVLEDAHFVRIDGRPVRVLRTNAGNGRPLLLINGIGAPIEMWEPFAAHLDDRELIRLDLPGCGLSPAPLVPLRMREIAAVVVRVMDALELPRADVLGYSFGGTVALELARRFQRRIDRLVLAATVPGWPGAVPHPAVVALMLNPLRYYNRRAAQMIVPLIAGGRTAADHNVMAAGLDLRQRHPPSVRGYTYQLAAVSTFSAWPWLHQVHHRTLVLHGRGDPVSPVLNARAISATLPDARLHVVPDGGHLVLLDDPERCAGVVRDFLT